jgi:hypothetical protein
MCWYNTNDDDDYDGDDDYDDDYDYNNTVTWFRWVVAELLRGPAFHPRLICVGYVANKVALGEVSLRVLQFSPVSKILSMPHTN